MNYRPLKKRLSLLPVAPIGNLAYFCDRPLSLWSRYLLASRYRGLFAPKIGGSSMGNSAIASRPRQSEQLLKTDADLEYQMVYQRGIEAVLWSMPAISDVFFRESL